MGDATNIIFERIGWQFQIWTTIFFYKNTLFMLIIGLVRLCRVQNNPVGICTAWFELPRGIKNKFLFEKFKVSRKVLLAQKFGLGKSPVIVGQINHSTLLTIYSMIYS